MTVQLQQPIISFTFDDFPRSALLTGGEILNCYGAAGTYYTALGLLNKTDEPSGPSCILQDLITLRERGHELASHTFTHCHSWKTSPADFEDSVVQNNDALSKLIPGAEFKSFSFPISEPRPATKKRTARHFLSCRGGGQTINAGTTDLNQLSSFFLEKSRDRIQEVKDLIDANKAARGWIIFATHDVVPNPSPYGVTPEFFEDVVNYSVKSGASILSVEGALERICSAGN